MALIIGTSGVWKEIANDLRKLGLAVAGPDDIGPLVNQLHAAYQPSVDLKKAEIAQRVRAIEDRITGLRAERGFFRSIANWFRTKGCEIRIARLRSEEQSYISTLLGNIGKLENLMQSPKLAGAEAELAVIKRLSHLSDEYIVFNDLLLEATRYIHFDGAPLESAQIDHLVLSPAGIFVIETKRWSRRFTESGEYHDPFQQVRRASYLCYDLVRADYRKIRVRSIIASDGHLPSPPPDSHVKVLSVDQVANHISGIRQREIEPNEIPALQGMFERYVNA